MLEIGPVVVATARELSKEIGMAAVPLINFPAVVPDAMVNKK
jgi:hypothetical protein